jgi:hypothetical protein
MRGRKLISLAIVLFFLTPISLVAAPSNDDFRNAWRLSGVSGVTNANTTGASGEAGEFGWAKSIWFVWRSEFPGRITLNTKGSGFDTLLQVYTKGSSGELISIAYNDDDPAEWDLSSRLTVEVEANTDYFVKVDGSFGDSGSLLLRWSRPYIATTPPTCDSFSSPLFITGSTGTVSVASYGASKEANEPNHAGNRGGRSAWFRWQATGTGSVVFDTLESDFDTLLAVYQGGTLSKLRPIISNDDAKEYENIQSRVSVPVLEGQIYYIAVDGRARYGEDADAGTIKLRWQCVGCGYVSDQPLTMRAELGETFSWTSDPRRYYKVAGRDVSGEWEEIGATIPGTGSNNTVNLSPSKRYSSYRISTLDQSDVRPIGIVREWFGESVTAANGLGNKIFINGLRAQGQSVRPEDEIAITYVFNPLTQKLETSLSQINEGLGPVFFGLNFVNDAADALTVLLNGQKMDAEKEYQIPVPSPVLEATLSRRQLFGLVVLGPTADMFVRVQAPDEQTILHKFVPRQPLARNEMNFPAMKSGRYSISFLNVGTNSSQCRIAFRNLNSQKLTEIRDSTQISGSFERSYLQQYYKYKLSLKQGQTASFLGSIVASDQVVFFVIDANSQLVTAGRGFIPTFKAQRSGDYFITAIHLPPRNPAEDSSFNFTLHTQ